MPSGGGGGCQGSTPPPLNALARLWNKKSARTAGGPREPPAGGRSELGVRRAGGQAVGSEKRLRGGLARPRARANLDSVQKVIRY